MLTRPLVHRLVARARELGAALVAHHEITGAETMPPADTVAWCAGWRTREFRGSPPIRT